MTYSACDFSDDVFGELHRIGAISDAEFNDPALEGNPSLAATYALNAIERLAAVIERLRVMQQVCGELASTNPFLADEFDRNKAVLKQLQ